MNAVRLLVVGMMMAVLTGAVQAEEKKADNAKLLLGTWEAVKVAPKTLAKGSLVEFAKDGKMKITMKDGDKEQVIDGTYKLDGDKFVITMKVGDEERKKTITIKKISEKELSTEDEDGKAVEFTRKK